MKLIPCFTLTVLALAAQILPTADQRSSLRDRVKTRDLSELPLLFIQNKGQADDRVPYYVQGRNCGLLFTKTGVTFDMSSDKSGSVLRLDHVGAKAGGNPE